MAGSAGVVSAVLFDFDGTLADSAPDLAAALNWMRGRRGLQPLPAAEVRPYASMGARGLLRIGFGLTPDDPAYLPMREEFLDRYAAHICVHTCLFPGIAELVAGLKQRGYAWGIATNKARRFTDLLLPRLLAPPAVQPDCVVCGDSTPHLKPHPAMLLLACKELAIPPERCMYLGDDLRDIQAGRAAGMRAVAVEWGYHGAADDGPATWNADARVARPQDLIALLSAR